VITEKPCSEVGHGADRTLYTDPILSDLHPILTAGLRNQVKRYQVNSFHLNVNFSFYLNKNCHIFIEIPEAYFLILFIQNKIYCLTKKWRIKLWHS